MPPAKNAPLATASGHMFKPAVPHMSLQDGASLIVGEEDPALRRRQMEEAAALQRSLQEGLIAAQLRDVNRLTAAASKLVV